MTVTFRIFKAFPPDLPGPVAQLTVSHDGIVDIPAEINRDTGDLKMIIFARRLSPSLLK